jgi:UDP-2,3-diacylglucosamine pyrophosphatase LpxH
MISWLQYRLASWGNSADRSASRPHFSAATTSKDAQSPRPPSEVARRYRAIFISDVHLGTRGCKAHYLLDFLRHTESDVLYLVGDIIDGWALKKTVHWPQAHNDVLQKVLRKARKGTRVVFIPGNHDEAARQFVGLDFGEVAIREDAVHTLVDGRRLWVVHGDFADGVMLHARWLAHVGDALYEFTLWLNHHLNRLRVRLGSPYWSLSQYLKHRVKNAVSFISDFEQVLLREARRRGYDGVVCGHIHKAEIRAIDGMLYANDGDWVESLTAVVETYEGQLEIIRWDRTSAPSRVGVQWQDTAIQPLAAAITAEEGP